MTRLPRTGRTPFAVAAAIVVATLTITSCGGDDASEASASTDTVTDATDTANSTVADESVPATDPVTTDPITTEPVTTEPSDIVTGESSAAFTITADVVGGQPQGGVRSYMVGVGQTVEITIASDTADEAHLHGYDLEMNLEPGSPSTLTFTADTAGEFEMELHGSGALLFYLDVT